VEPATQRPCPMSHGHLSQSRENLTFPSMKTLIDESSSNPAVHSAHLQQELSALIDHMHEDIGRVAEPQFQALLETSAEVLGGLRKAFLDYGKHSEPAWRSSAK
jgi:hypothetical protein